MRLHEAQLRLLTSAPVRVTRARPVGRPMAPFTNWASPGSDAASPPRLQERMGKRKKRKRGRKGRRKQKRDSGLLEFSRCANQN